MAQDRKVFVGGVPQDLNQDDLYAIFSEYAGVKKAWLQKCRAGDDGSVSSPPQNHRGFGFVIFHDAQAIDDLLGSGSSRFIVLRNGTKLEVKRALSSNKMGQETAAAEAARRNGQAQASRADQQPPLHATGLQRALPTRGPNRLIPSQVLGPGSATMDAALLRLMQQQQAQAHAFAYAGGPQALAQLMSAGTMPGHGDVAALLEGRPGVYGALSHLSARSSPAPPGLMGVNGLSHLLPADGESLGGTRNRPLRDAIVQFYHEHRPEKLTERDFIDFICNVYEGRESELDEALRQKYGTGLAMALNGKQSVPERPTASRPRRAGRSSQTALSAGSGSGQLHHSSLSGAGLDYNTHPPEAWLPLAHPAQACAAAMAAAAQARGPVTVPTPWLEQAGPRAKYLQGDLYSSFDELESFPKTLEQEAQGPDISWIDSIVADDSARAIATKSAAFHRKDMLQNVAVTGSSHLQRFVAA